MNGSDSSYHPPSMLSLALRSLLASGVGYFLSMCVNIGLILLKIVRDSELSQVSIAMHCVLIIIAVIYRVSVRIRFVVKGVNTPV